MNLPMSVPPVDDCTKSAATLQDFHLGQQKRFGAAAGELHDSVGDPAI
jgi:hypothetical protein